MFFKFYINNHIHFKGKLHCEQCEGTSKNGQRCRRRVCIGSPYCYQHLRSEKHLEIKKSNIAKAGKGLFAYGPPDEVIFKKNETIIKYDGELIDEREVRDRYAEFTAPYTIELKDSEFEDGALERGPGSLANQGIKNNARLGVYFNSTPHYALLKATKNIYGGQEILVDYGDRYQFDEEGVHFITR
jgi:hypothetical protein